MPHIAAPSRIKQLLLMISIVSMPFSAKNALAFPAVDHQKSWLPLSISLSPGSASMKRKSVRQLFISIPQVRSPHITVVSPGETSPNPFFSFSACPAHSGPNTSMGLSASKERCRSPIVQSISRPLPNKTAGADNNITEIP